MPVSNKKRTLRRLLFLMPWMLAIIGLRINLNVTLAFVFALIAFIIFNLVVKNFVNFESYFMSKYNVLTLKTRRTNEFDLPKDIVFDKLLEVLPIAGFKVEESDLSSGHIFAINDMSSDSNGENMYIHLKDKGEKAVVNFKCANFGLASSKAAKEDNYDRVILEFEKSLII